MRRINPLNDFAFKKIFGEKGRERELIAFLNSILRKTLPSPIVEITILENKELPKDLLHDKQGIVDIRARLADGTIINIEIQLDNHNNMEKRTVFYWSKLYVGGIKEGANYQELPKVITINILDFNLLGTKDFHSTFHLWEDTEKDYMLTDVVEIHFIEYPKFKKLVGANYMKDPLSMWLTLLQKDVDEQVVKELVKMEPAMAYVEETIDYISSTPDMIDLYEAREKARLDHINMMDSATEKGRVEGRAEGMEKGMEKGVEQTKIANATALLDILDNETISLKIGLSIEHVEKLRREND